MSQKKSSKSGIETVDKTKDHIIIALGATVFFLLSALVAVNISPNEFIESEPLKAEINEKKRSEVSRLRYWGVNLEDWHENGPMRTMNRVFERLQFEFVNASNGDDWDILWSTDHPDDASTSDFAKVLFAGVNEIQLRPDQKVNHFDGIGALVNKIFMSRLNAELPYILPIFFMPEHRDRLKNFLKENPNVSIVEKNNYNRGVKIVKPAEVREESYKYFYQQFMEDHFLIDGHAFDFGVFVLITSFDPLRIYRYKSDVLFRFCAKKYHPFDAKDVDKYVVQEGAHIAIHMPLFEQNYKRYQLPFIKLFEKHIADKGFDVKELWRKIDDAIVKIVSKAESNVLREMKRASHTGYNYFELVRFDFLFDSKLNPYVMEVNMSPNLTPASKRYEENAKIYEPLVYNTIQMIGGASHFEFHSRFNDSDITVAGQKHISVGVETCLKYDCYRNCDNPKCSICLPCVSSANRYQMREAVREHKYGGNFKRLFPTKLHYYDNELISNMTESNKISIKWFRAQCESNNKWC